MIIGEQPIFEIKGTAGTEPLRLAAGINDQELYTDFKLEPLQVLTLSGLLKTRSCQTECPNSLQLLLRQNARLSRGVNLIGKKTFFKAIADSIVIKVKNFSGQSNSTGADLKHRWTVNEKVFSNDESIELGINPVRVTTICLDVLTADGSSSSQCQTVDLNLIDSFPGLKVSLVPVQRQDKSWILQSVVSGVGPFKYNWDNKVLEKSSIELDPKAESKHCLKIIDERGNVASACVEWSPSGRLKCKADFEFGVEAARLQSWTQYNSAELTYIDAQGVVWNSAGAEQRPASVIEILEDKPYEINDKKQNTRKIKINIDAILFNKIKNKLSIKAEGYMAVAVPE